MNKSIDQDLNDEEKLKCPKCDSTQLTADKRGFSAGKAVAGAVLTGGVGFMAGLHGKDKLVVYCMACGEKWKPAEYLEKKKKYERVKKLNNQVEEHKKRSLAREALINLYERGDREEALKFAKHHKLAQPSNNDIDDIYQKNKKAYNKNEAGKFALMMMMGLLFCFLVYQCNK